MKILICGLPGSGKTWLAERLIKVPLVMEKLQPKKIEAYRREEFIGGLKKSKLPCLIKGGGCKPINSQQRQLITSFIENNNIPVIFTYKAPELIQKTHPLHLGRTGLYPSNHQDFLNDC